jgi:hypothetical protein
MSRESKRSNANFFLLKELIVRDLRARYAGSGLGWLWAFASPVLWMALYTLVFSVILRVGSPPGYAGFPEFLLAGLLPWMAFHEAITRSSTALTDNGAMVKKTVFPIETLLVSIVLAGLVNQLFAFSVFAIYLAAIGHLSLPWILLALPALVLQAALTYGLACLVATISTFVRDAVPLVGIALDRPLLCDADRLSGRADAGSAPGPRRRQSPRAPRLLVSRRFHAASRPRRAFHPLSWSPSRAWRSRRDPRCFERRSPISRTSSEGMFCGGAC